MVTLGHQVLSKLTRCDGALAGNDGSSSAFFALHLGGEALNMPGNLRRHQLAKVGGYTPEVGERDLSIPNFGWVNGKPAVLAAAQLLSARILFFAQDHLGVVSNPLPLVDQLRRDPSCTECP